MAPVFTWSNAQSKTRLPLNSIILQEGVIDSLVEDVKEFLETGTSRLEYLTEEDICYHAPLNNDVDSRDSPSMNVSRQCILTLCFPQYHKTL